MICPFYHKKDQVVSIVYGLSTEKMFEKADQGNVKLGGCILSDNDPKWYCKKDDQAF
jgi:hypothetical protein